MHIHIRSLLMLSLAIGCPLLQVQGVTKNSNPAQEKQAETVANKAMTVYQVDPLIKITPDQESFPYSNDTLRVARGENAVLHLQIEAQKDLSNASASLVSLVSDHGASLSGATIGWVHNVKSSYRNYVYGKVADDNIESAGCIYPDPIITDRTETIPRNSRAALWVDIPIPTSADAGLYKGIVRIEAKTPKKTVSIEKPFCVQVYPVTIDRQRLLVTNWEQGNPFPYMNNGEKVPFGSDLYWDLREKLIRISSDYGSNAWRIQHNGVGVSSNPEGTDFVFDFTPFDREVEFYLANANVAQIHGLHFAGRGGWTDPFNVNIRVLDGCGGISNISVEPSDPRVKTYIDAYFPALQEHLRSKPLNDGTGRSWLDIFAQFVGDEPIDANLDSWENIARMIKAAAPEIKIIEAYRASSYDSTLIDYPVPQLDEFADWSIYRNLSREQNVWIYTCMFPRDNYANRFVTLPLIKTRILHWINYKYNAVGYLHWGLEYWDGVQDPYGEISVPGNDWPGGDSHIVYPGYRKVYPSIRLAAMRDGIRDYELLRMIEDLDPAKAKAFADAIVLDYDRYDTNVLHFRQIRKEMLEFLSGE